MSDEETRRSIELKEYFIITPFKGIYNDIQYDYNDLVSRIVTNPYVSSDADSLSLSKISKMLIDYELISPPENQLSERYWPGDKEEKS